MIRPGARAEVDAPARGAAVLGGELAGDDLLLFDRVARRLYSRLSFEFRREGLCHFAPALKLSGRDAECC